MLVLHILALVLTLIHVHGKIYLRSVTTSFNPKMLSHFEIKVFNDSLGSSLINMTAQKITDIRRSRGYFSIKFKSNLHSDDYDLTFMNGNIDTCAKVQSANFVEKMVGQLIENYSNLKFGCPRLKGFYYATNVPVDIDVSMIPSYLFGTKGGCKWNVWVNLKESESANKSVPLTQAFTMKFFGETIYGVK